MDFIMPTKIKVYRVCQMVCNGAFYPPEEEVEFAVCTSEELANKAIDRLVTENYENRESLYIVEDEIIFDTIYGWDDGNLTV